MCRTLSAAGVPVVANDVREEVAAEAVASGARWAATAAEAAAGAGVLVTMLPGPAEVQDVMTGAGAAMMSLAPGATWIDMSSTSPQVGDVLLTAARERGIDLLDAPVGGGVPAATVGTLQLYVGGPAGVLARHRRLLEVVAAPGGIHHMGANGAGYVTKLLVNLLWFGQAVAIGEALLLAGRSGIDLELMRRTLASGPAGSAMLDRDVPALLTGDYLRSFGIARCHEELVGIGALARANGLAWDLSTQVTQIYARAAERFGEQDGELLAVALLEEQAGQTLRAG